MPALRKVIDMPIRFAIGVAAALALTACGGHGEPVAVPAGPVKGDTPSRDFVIGKWGTNGSCEKALDLRSDGTTDGPVGDWTYKDGVIGFTDVPELKVTVTVVDDKTMDSTNSDGEKAIMTRCP